jgi:hypothetical protein
MGWFRLFDRLRLRPDAEAPDGWALPGGTLRLTDPHLASYFREMIAASGVSAQAGLYDIVSHALARSTTPSPGRFHVDIRGMGAPSSLLFGSDSAHALLAWHDPSRLAALRLAGQEMVELREADLLALCSQHLPLSEIATLSAWLPDAEAAAKWMQRLEPWLTDQTRVVIRLPGAALAQLVALLPSWPSKPVVLLPCEPAEEDPAGPLPGVLLCLEEVSRQSVAAATQRASGAERILRAKRWPGGPGGNTEGGIGVTAIGEARAASIGPPVTLLGDAPPTPVGAALFAMQRSPMRGEAARGVRIELQAASVFVRDGEILAVPLSGPAVAEPGDLAWQDDAPDIVLTRSAPVHLVVDRPAILLGRPTSRDSFLATTWPKLELAFELIEREKIAPGQVDLLLPGGADEWVRAAIALCGFDPAQIRTECEGVLFRRLILASPACDLAAPRRGDLFDRFWQRLPPFALGGRSASLTAPGPTGRVMLLGADSQLLNATELAALARDRLYRVIDPGLTSPQEMAAVLRDARVVVAQPAEAIWSALAPSGALGLLQTDTDPAIPYAALHAASARGHQVIAMFGSAIGNDPSAAFVVAADRLALMMDRLEAAAGLAVAREGDSA